MQMCIRDRAYAVPCKTNWGCLFAVFWRRMIILHPVYYGRMRKSLLILLFFVSLGGVHKASAQLDKHYFFYVGRSYIIDNKFRDAIETLNVLLKVDEKAYEGYFLRGIAKYNLDDLLGAEQDLSLIHIYLHDGQESGCGR